MNPPTGRETTSANSEINGRLFAWWSKHELGLIADSSGGFYLPDNSILSPDAAYISPQTQQQMASEKQTIFFPLCPDFVVELLSKSDSLAETREKMEHWIANGARLGWLIDPYRRNAHIYEQGREASIFSGKILKGQGPVNGFDLDLARIWRYYEK